MKLHILAAVKLKRSEDREEFETTCAQVCTTLHKNAPGIIRSELARDTKDPDSYILLGQWQNRDAWANWQRSIREQHLNPLEQYWTDQGVRICETVFCLKQDRE